MLSEKKLFPPPVLTSEGLSPLGPFPRHIWIHNNTPQDGLDEACHEIWKRAQKLSEELQPPPLQRDLCSGPSWTLPRDTTNSQSTTYLLDEPEGLENIYRAMLGNKEREMKLKALCDAQLSAKAVLTSFLSSAKAPKNSKELEKGSMRGTPSTKGSKMPLLRKHPGTARAAGAQVAAKETPAAKESTPKSTSSSAKSGTAVSTTTAERQAAGQKQQIPPAAAERQAAGQKQQIPRAAKICSKTDFNAVIKNPASTAAQDKKNVKYNGSGSGFSTTTMTIAFNRPVWQSLDSFPFLIPPNYLNFPQLQGPNQQVRILYQQVLHPAPRCYSRQVVPYSLQQFSQPPYPPVMNYITLVQPVYPHQMIPPPPLSPRF